MMTLKEYLAWDGTYTKKERATAEKREEEMLATLTEEETDTYFDLCMKHVYAEIDFGKAEHRKTAKTLHNFCKAHNFSIEEAMIVY